MADPVVRGAADDAGNLRRGVRAVHAARAIRAAVLVAAAYYVGAEIGLALTLTPQPVSTLWPPNAIVMAALLCTPTRAWWLILLAALPAHLAVELQAGIPAPMVLSWFVSNACEAVIGAGAVRSVLRSPLRFDSFRHIGVFLLLAVFLAPFLSSFLDAALVALNGWGRSGYWDVWRTRFFSNMLAVLTLVPVIVIASVGGLASAPAALRRRYGEAGVLAAALLTACLAVFVWRTAGPSTTPALLYAPLPFLLWAALRFGPGGTSVAFLGVAFLAIWGVTRGRGPFVTSSPAENALSMQLFLIVAAVPFMALAAVLQERRRVEEDARQNEERLALALSAAQLGTWDWAIASDRGVWSAKSREIFGFTAANADITFADFLDRLCPEDRSSVAQAIGRTLEQGAPYEIEFRVLQPNGDVRWVLSKGKAFFDDTGRPVRMVGVNADVTERKQAHATVVEWKDRYEAAIQSSNQLLYDWNPTTSDVTYGGDLERILGYSPEEMAGGISHWIAVIHPEDRAAFLQEIERVLACHDSFNLTYRVCRRDGTVIWLDDRGHFFRDSAGQLRMVGFVEDITEWTRTEQKAQEHRREVMHLSRVALLGELSGALAHELNQPLTAILANARAAERLLEHGATAGADLSEILADIVHDGRRAGEVIRHLRALLKRGEVQPKPVNLNDVVLEALDLLHSDLIQRRIDVDARLAPVPLVLADRVQLQQVLLNLLLNACDAMSVKPRGRGRLAIVTAPVDNGGVWLSLADQGTGIPDDKIDQIFEPFFTSKEHGLGLGLAICRSIVVAHRGRLWAVNNEEGGATFHMVLRGEARAAPTGAGASQGDADREVEVKAPKPVGLNAVDR